jgi:hypothetical protein
MRKLQNLGRSLSKIEQKRIIGGEYDDAGPCISDECSINSDCGSGYESKNCGM